MYARPAPNYSASSCCGLYTDHRSPLHWGTVWPVKNTGQLVPTVFRPALMEQQFLLNKTHYSAFKSDTNKTLIKQISSWENIKMLCKASAIPGKVTIKGERPHTTWVQPYDLLEKTKVWRQEKGEWLPEVGEGRKGWGRMAVGLFYNDGYMSPYTVQAHRAYTCTPPRVNPDAHHT